MARKGNPKVMTWGTPGRRTTLSMAKCISHMMICIPGRQGKPESHDMGYLWPTHEPKYLSLAWCMFPNPGVPESWASARIRRSSRIQGEFPHPRRGPRSCLFHGLPGGLDLLRLESTTSVQTDRSGGWSWLAGRFSTGGSL